MEKKPLSTYQKYFFGTSAIGVNWVRFYSMYMLTFFLTDIAKIPITSYLALSSIGSIVTLFTVPILGVIITKSKPGKWGRTRKWLIATSAFFFIPGVLLYTRIGSMAFSLALLAVMLPISGTFLSGMAITSGSMSGVIASNQQDRALLSSRISLYGKIGSLLYSAASATVLAFAIKLAGGNPLNGYWVAGLIGCSISFLSFLNDFLCTKGYDLTDADYATAQANPKTAAVAKQSSPSIKEIGRCLIKNPHFAFLASTSFCISVSQFVISAMLIYYYTYVAESTSMYTLYLTISNGSAVVMAFVAPFVTKKIGIKATAIVSIAIAVFGLVFARLLGLNPIVFIVGGSLYNIGLALRGAVVYAQINDCAIYSEWKEGAEARATLASVHMIFAASLPSIVRAVFVSIALASSGYVAGEIANAATKARLLNGTVMLPLIFVALALVLAFLYKLNPEKVNEMEKGIKERAKII